MPNSDGTEAIDDDEILYRRIPVSKNWYTTEGGVSPEAFDPRPDEKTGISVYRGKYKSAEEAAQGKSKRGYYVAEFLAGDLRAKGVAVVPRPLAADPGHSELPGLTCDNRLTREAQELKVLLANLHSDVKGPYFTSTA
jgi:hypothetical protein